MEFVVEFSAGFFALVDENPRRGVSPLHSAASNLSSYQAAGEGFLRAASLATSRPSVMAFPAKRATSGPSDSFAYPRRLDWPLVDTLDELRDVIFEARERLVGLRIPVLIPGTAKLPFEPPRRLCVYLGTGVIKGNLVRRSVPNCTSHALGFALGSAEAVFRRAYFPAGFQPVSEWHVEYSIELLDVPRELIPESFRCEDEA